MVVGFLNDKGEVVCSVDRWCLTYKYRDSNSDIIHAYFSGFSDIARVNNCPGWRIDLHVARSRPKWTWKKEVDDDYNLILKFYINAKT
jgi:hypothetical protein